jgi:hypothetical protein
VCDLSVAEPATGRPSTRIKIHGSGFDSVIAVGFGSRPAHHFAVISDTKIEADAPDYAPGMVEVRVATIYGLSEPSDFTYTGK